MSKEEKKREVEVRPRNWLVPVILLTLREWDSYGYELMERTAAFRVRGYEPGYFVPDIEADGEERRRRVQVGDL